LTGIEKYFRKKRQNISLRKKVAQLPVYFESSFMLMMKIATLSFGWKERF
jgi:hypothetical protein